MPPNEAEKLPDDPTDLARIVSDERAPEDHRNQALGKLQPLIRRLAKLAENRLGGKLGSEFIEGAVTYYWERRTSFDPDEGRFAAWCWRILVNRGIDLLRSRHRERTQQASEARLANEPDLAEASGQSREAAAEALANLVKERRAFLDQMSWRPASAKATNYFAVFLLQLRLAMAEGIGASLDEADELPDKMAYLLAEYLPWWKAEECLRFKSSWPTLHQIWAALKADLNRPPYCVSIAALCDLLTNLLKGKLMVTRDLWYQWVKRGKDIARNRMDPEDWEWFFAVWFPDRRPKPVGLTGSVEGETS